jgi:ankyrin repeat protein
MRRVQMMLCAAVLLTGLMSKTLEAAGEIPLVDAVKDRNAAAVKALLQKKVDVNATEGDGATALHWAVYRDDPGLVDMLIAAGAKVNITNDLKITPLSLAAANGNSVIVDKLLKAGANPDSASETGVTPLMEAARVGSAPVVRSLLDHEANVNAKESERQQTALMWAAAEKHPDVVKLLLDKGADVRARTKVRNLTVMLDNGSRGVKTSRQNATPIEAGGSTPLLFAAQSGDVESAKLLLAARADPNDTGADGNSALVLAAFTGNGLVCPILLAAGADPNAAGAGYTALHAAALRGDVATVNALLAKGANPDLQITKGSPVRRFGAQWTLPSTLIGATPLLVAATYLEVDVVRALVNGHASPSLTLPNGTSPLLAAAGIAVQREPRPPDILLDADSPVLFPRSEKNVVDSVRALLDAGADVNQANDAGDTALHAAAGAGMTSVIQLLADRGAKLDVKNKQGQTPLALTMPRSGGGRGGGGGGGGGNANPEAQARAKAAEELLRKLGATP